MAQLQAPRRAVGENVDFLNAISGIVLTERQGDVINPVMSSVNQVPLLLRSESGNQILIAVDRAINK